MIQNIWLSSVANPAGAAALVEEALRIKYQVTTMGPVISEHVIQSRHMQELQPKIRPHDLIVPAEQDMQEVLSLVNPRQLPDFFLWVESAETYHPKNLQSLPCPKAAYFIHGQPNTAEKISWASQFDYVFLTQRNLVKDFKAAGISNAYWLPPGFSPVIHKQTSLLKKHDVSFVGTVNKGSLRESLLARVKERFPLLIKQCFLEKMAEVFSQSKIVLNYSEQSEINRRIFEVMGTGSFLLTNRAPGSGIDEIFTDGEELAFFDQDDLCEKIGYYLDRGFVREKIAARGNAMVKNGFTFAHRCEDMVAVIEGRKNDTPDPAELRSRSKAVVTVSGGRAHKEYSLEEILQYDPGFPQGRSFIIPVLDLKSQTEYTFHTLLRDLEEIEGDVIAVFNSPAMADLFKGHPRITYSASISHNVGVSRAWNIGLDIARTPVSFILNSDLHITPEVINTLEKSLLELEDAAIVGVEGGFVDFYATNDIERYLHGTFNETMRVDSVSGFFFAVKTKLFNDGILHFENQFTPCYYEEWDLGIQIRTKGLKAYIIPASGWEHEFNTKARTGNLHYYNESEPVLKISDRNQKLFWKKWLNYARETGDVANLQSLWFQKKKEEGENLLAQNQLNEAEIVFKAILQREPVEINALYYLGFINYMKGLNELAEQFFLKVLEINPEAKQARTYLDTIRQNISN